MSNLFWFRCCTPENRLSTSTLVIFSGPSEFSLQDLEIAIADSNLAAVAPEAVLIFVPCAQESTLLPKLPASHTAFEPLAKRDTSIFFIIYETDGSWRSVNLTNPHRGKPTAKSLDYIRRQGLTSLARKWGAVLDSGPTAHFVKPSKRTGLRFLRASQAMSEGAEIFFIAFWLLPLISPAITRIHLDTTSIASVVLAALLMKGAPTASFLPVLSSFRSYDGIESHPFDKRASEIIVISASQSGAMASAVKSKIADESLIVTVFSLSETTPVGTIICDLSFDKSINPYGFEIEAQHQAAKPPSTRPIRIIGEHFILKPSPANVVMPVVDLAPEVVKDRLSKIANSGIFYTNRSQQQAKSRAVWVDVRALCWQQVFLDWMKERVDRDIPVSVRAIVCASRNEETVLLAKAIEHLIRLRCDTINIRQLTLMDIENDPLGWADDNAAIVVVTAATSNGRSLESASRALRSYASKSYRIYITAATTASNADTLRILNSNLVHGGNKFFSFMNICLDQNELLTSWEEERTLLASFEDDLPDELRERWTSLRQESRGLYDNLFFPGPSGCPLALRNNFAFWPPDQDSSRATQSDVFVTVSAILEELRTGLKVPQDKKLLNDPQTNSVISPNAFTRFNDGVIQAALLRSARPIELNYQASTEQSSFLAVLIGQMAERSGSAQGEALAEFLLALALERLKLTPLELNSLLSKLDTLTSSLGEVEKWLMLRIKETVSKT